MLTSIKLFESLDNYYVQHSLDTNVFDENNIIIQRILKLVERVEYKEAKELIEFNNRNEIEKALEKIDAEVEHKVNETHKNSEVILILILIINLIII